MLVTAFIFITLIVFASSSDLNVYGYVFNVNGDMISRYDKDVYYRRLIVTSSIIDISHYHNFTETTAFHEMIDYGTHLRGYLLSFKYQLKNIDDKNATKFISLYENYHSFDPTIISQNLNNKIQNTSLISSFYNQYFVITGIEILCDINVNQTDSKYIETNRICNGNVSSGRVYVANNQTFFTMPNYDSDDAIINFFATGNSFIHFGKANNYTQTGGENLKQVQYDLFYPNRNAYGSSAKMCYHHRQTSNISDTDIIILLQYNECNTQIMYDNPWHFQSDIEQTGFFDLDLMNNKYKHLTNNGSFIYYALGGVCSGIFCSMDGINWMQPVITTYAPTTKPTSYPTNNIPFPSIDYAYQSTDKKWWILSLIFINLFVCSCVVLGGAVVYLWNQKHQQNKNYNSVVNK